MKYIDEKIISTMMKTKENIQMSLLDGYYINGKLEKFNKVGLFEDTFFVFLPSSFVDMPEQIKRLKYPSIYRPKIIKTNLDNSVNFAFSILENADGMGVKELVNNFISVLKRTNPAIIFSDIFENTLECGSAISGFSFTSFGLDTNIYNIICLLPVHDLLVECIFNCAESDVSNWENVAKDVLFNISVQQ